MLARDDHRRGKLADEGVSRGDGRAEGIFGNARCSYDGFVVVIHGDCSKEVLAVVCAVLVLVDVERAGSCGVGCWWW